MHIGSQIVSLDPFRQALQRLAIVCSANCAGTELLLKFLDFGGGLGVRYTNEKPPRAKRMRGWWRKSSEPLRHASSARAGADDHWAGGSPADACSLCERKSRQDVCGC